MVVSLLLGAALGAAAAAAALSPSPPDALLTFRLALRPSAPGLAALHGALHASADPASPGWGRHLSREAADALTRPPAAQARAVLAHLAASCAAAAELTRSHEWAVVRASPACARELFGVAAVQHAPGVQRCAGQPRVPQGLEAAVAAVAPCSRAPGQGALVVRARGGGSAAAAAAAAAASTTPATIRAQYGLGKYEGSGAGRIQVAGFLDEFAEDADLQAFFRSFYPPGVGRTFAVVGPNGRVSGVEAALDVQYVMSIGANLSTTFWYTDAGSAPNPNDNEPYLTWLLNVTDLPDAQLPHTISVSYADDEDTIDPAYALAVETLMAKLGARGVSLLHASGDGGVEGTQAGACLDGGKRFRPTWPASAPYVTAVGSTDASYARASGFSGGGFSNRHATPPFQAAAVAGYLASGGGGSARLPPRSYYNASGRGFPDVAAVGEGFAIVSGGATFAVDGTSCSTPTFAGIVGLLNDARVGAGKGGLGWLNPLLYAHPEAFTDISAGSNPGCGTEGFPAVKGWDPVTGLGAPVWPALLKLALALP